MELPRTPLCDDLKSGQVKLNVLAEFLVNPGIKLLLLSILDLTNLAGRVQCRNAGTKLKHISKRKGRYPNRVGRWREWALREKCASLVAAAE
ncbi:hypothetical protein M413DRAFT_285275 [Hebeloma cylindrosporum]|uniref:Uncharacterized protein n=1 Tax=Hebeloma cylindrosporum TaxID=76867 RepID=A0A0C2Y713_HEBCY|nr:hypothetical protein M413DRAFT_285275 [Hebeloma cylindrosporum h7]